MKSEYNYEEQIETCTCPVCGYKHSKEYKEYGRTVEGDKPFIKMEGFEFHSTDNSDGWHPHHNTYTVYACPKCGVLQVST